MLTGVEVVEPARLSTTTVSENATTPTETHPAGYPFQVGYQENDQKYVLYLLADKDQDRADWIQSLRTGTYLHIVCYKKKFVISLPVVTYVSTNILKAQVLTELEFEFSFHAFKSNLYEK